MSLFKDRVTGFHWLLERTHAASTILGRRELVHQLATKPNLAGVVMAYKPTLDSVEQRTLMSAAEPKTVQGLTQYEYYSFLDQFRLGGGNSKALFNTLDKARLQSESDQIGKDASGITQRLLLDAPPSHILAECLSETSGVRRHVAAREAFQRQVFHACRLAPVTLTTLAFVMPQGMLLRKDTLSAMVQRRCFKTQVFSLPSLRMSSQVHQHRHSRRRNRTPVESESEPTADAASVIETAHVSEASHAPSVIFACHQAWHQL